MLPRLEPERLSPSAEIDVRLSGTSMRNSSVWFDTAADKAGMTVRKKRKTEMPAQAMRRKGLLGHIPVNHVLCSICYIYVVVPDDRNTPRVGKLLAAELIHEFTLVVINHNLPE